MEEFKQLILGEVSVAYYAAAEVFALLALIISLWLHSKKRDASSPTTPQKFSWGFLFWDNFKRIIVGQITMFLVFRFATEFLGRKLDMWMAVGIGAGLSFGLDRFIMWMQSRTTVFDMNREKFMEKQNNQP